MKLSIISSSILTVLFVVNVSPASALIENTINKSDFQVDRSVSFKVAGFNPFKVIKDVQGTIERQRKMDDARRRRKQAERERQERLEAAQKRREEYEAAKKAATEKQRLEAERRQQYFESLSPEEQKAYIAKQQELRQQQNDRAANLLLLLLGASSFSSSSSGSADTVSGCNHHEYRSSSGECRLDPSFSPAWNR